MNLKKLLTLSISVISTHLLNGQNVNFEWVKQMEGNGNFPSIPMVDLDENGNIYTFGAFSGTVDFDPGIGVSNLTSQSTYDIFVSKLDASGNFYWAKRIGGSEDNYAAAFTLDNTGNIYATGEFRGTVDFNPDAGTYNLTSDGFSDAYILKLDASGNFVWAKQLGATNAIQTLSITTDSNGSVYVTGGYSGTVDFDPGAATYNLTSIGASDIFICKLSASGVFQWAKSMGGSSNNDSGLSIKTDVNNNIYTTGYFHGTADFDPSSSVYNLSAPQSAIFVSKLDASGNFVWAKQMGSAASIARSIFVADGHLYSTGGLYGTGDFDPGTGTANLTSSGFEDVFVSKLDGVGNFIWAKQMGGGQYDGGKDIVTDSEGYVYTSGFFASSADFNPGIETHYLTSAGSDDAFINKLDLLGNFVWTIQLGGTQQDVISNIKVDGNGDIYVSGFFKGTVDFDPGVGTFNLTAPISGGNMFILKLSQTTTGVYRHNSNRGFTIYPNPTDEILAIKCDEIHKKLNVRILSTLGKEMANLHFVNTGNINLEINMPNGSYILEILDEMERVTFIKFIKL